MASSPIMPTWKDLIPGWEDLKRRFPIFSSPPTPEMIQSTPAQEDVWARRRVGLPDVSQYPIGSQERLLEENKVAGRTIGPTSMFSRPLTPRESPIFPGSVPNPEQLLERLSESPLGLAAPDPGDLAGLPFSWYKKNILGGNPLTKGIKAPAGYGDWMFGMEDPAFIHSGMDPTKAEELWRSKVNRPVARGSLPIEPQASNVLDLSQPNMDDMSQIIASLEPEERNRILRGFKAARELSRESPSELNLFLPREMDPYKIRREDVLPTALSKQISPTDQELAKSPFDAVRSLQVIPGTNKLINIWKIPETTSVKTPWGTELGSPPFKKTRFLSGERGLEDLPKRRLEYKGTENPYGIPDNEPYFVDEKHILDAHRSGLISPEQFDYSIKHWLNGKFARDIKYPTHVYFDPNNPYKIITFLSNMEGLSEWEKMAGAKGMVSTVEDWINSIKNIKQNVDITDITRKFSAGAISPEEFRNIVENTTKSRGINWIVVNGYDDMPVGEYKDVKAAQEFSKNNDGTYVVNIDDYIKGREEWHNFHHGEEPMGGPR